MKIIILAGATRSLVNFRGDLIKEMVLAGHEVVCMGPEGDNGEVEHLGAQFRQVVFNRSSTNPMTVIKTINTLKRAFKDVDADIYFGYTDTPCTLGVIAATQVGIPHKYAMLTGIGNYYDNPSSIKETIVGAVLKRLMNYALNKCERIVFQNPDDCNLFCDLNIVKRESCDVVNGSGVNLDHFRKTPLPDNRFAFIFVGALMKQKGFLNYIEAAKLVKKEYPNIEFDVIGGLSKRISSISYEDLNKLLVEGAINYYGHVKDVRPYIENSTCFVLPSYREGVPRSGLEALAMGRPIITTDTPGCREIVDNGVNGLLVEVNNSKELAKAMSTIIEARAGRLIEMSEASRKLAEEKFDVVKVNSNMMAIMNMTGGTRENGVI